MFLYRGRLRRPVEIFKGAGSLQESSQDSATFSSPEARRFLGCLLTRASDDPDGAGKPQFATGLSPCPGGNLQGRTDWAHVRPSN